MNVFVACFAFFQHVCFLIRSYLDASSLPNFGVSIIQYQLQPMPFKFIILSVHGLLCCCAFVEGEIEGHYTF